MSDLFQERYRELPIFQRYMDLLKDGIFEDKYSLQELATRLIMAAENGLTWDTLCNNCGVLMNDNYAQHVQIEQLRSDNEFLRQRIESLQEDLAYAENEARDLQEELDSEFEDYRRYPEV